jgi:hypothetical protein
MKLNSKNNKMIAFFDELNIEKENIQKNTRACLKEIYDTIKECSRNLPNMKKKKSYVRQCPYSSSVNSYYMPEKIKRFLETTPCYYSKYETIQNSRRIFIHF